MPPYLAAFCCVLGIAGLFLLNRDWSVRTSGALWLPVAWLSIVGSRNVSEWLQAGRRVDVGSAYMEGSPLDRNILTLLLVAALVTLVARWQRVGAVLRENLPLIAYFLYCGVSVLWSDYPLVGVKRLFRSMGDITMVLVILTDRNSRVAIQRVLTRVGFVLLPMSILLIRYFPHLGRAYVPWNGAVLWTGVAGGKNGLGQTCLIYGLAATWCFLATYSDRNQPHRKGRLIAQAVAAGMAIYLLWLVDSKTSLACYVLAAGLVGAISFVSFLRKPLVLNLMVLALVLVPFSVLFLDVGSGALETLGRDSSLTGRTDIWEIAERYVDNPIVGAGYENFWLGKRLERIVREHGVFLNQAHNGYIEIYLNLGVIGVTLLTLLIVSNYFKIVSRIRLDPELCSLMLAYIVVAVVYNFTEGAFKMMSSVWVALLLATTSVSAVRAQNVLIHVAKARKALIYGEAMVTTRS